MYIKISDTAHLFDRLGSERGQEFVTQTLGTVCAVLGRYGGQVVSSDGNELVCCFTNVEHAVNAACDVHESLAEDSDALGRSPWISARIGFHFGPASIEGDRVAGEAAEIASHLARSAQSRQSLTSGKTLADVPASLREQARPVGRIALPRSGDMEVLELPGQAEDMTSMTPDLGRTESRGACGEVTIHYHDEMLILTEDGDAVVLGRSPVCDIRISESRASRQHLRLELRGEQYYVIDQSTNGTYVRSADGESRLLCQEEMALAKGCDISPGREFETTPGDCIHVEFRAHASM